MSDPYSSFGDIIKGAVLWESLEADLRERNRFAPKAHAVAQRFVDGCLKLRKDYASGTELFRARIMPLGHQRTAGPYGPDSPDVGAPPPAKASGGRLNPTGIPYLYLATSKETAIDEVRAWPEALVTVATFRLNRGCDLVALDDLSFEGADPAVGWIAHVLSRPTDRRDPLAYIASQYIAEHIKAQGVDGIEYRSSFDALTAWNVALFDPTLATATSTELRRVDRVQVSSHEVL